MITSTATLISQIHQIVPELLKDHAYGVYELAQECARQLHEPVCEIMTPFCESLFDMVNGGELRYDRQHNQVALI